jgi:hypothetical protein
MVVHRPLPGAHVGRIRREFEAIGEQDIRRGTEAEQIAMIRFVVEGNGCWQ